MDAIPTGRPGTDIVTPARDPAAAACHLRVTSPAGAVRSRTALQRVQLAQRLFGAATPVMVGTSIGMETE